MSRIGKMPVIIPEKVEVDMKGNNLSVKWPLWTLVFTFSDKVNVKKEENSLIIEPIGEDAWALWGTTRAVLANMVQWVSEGYKKTLELQWVGYKFEVQWNKIIMSLGFSHKVEMIPPEWIKVTLDEKEKNTIHIFGIDKQLVWEFTAKIRAKKKPEPYKWKWIRYAWEQVRRKAGKTWKK